MAVGYLHGVELVEFNAGPVPITVVNSAVIGLVGSAPLFAVSGALRLWDPSSLVQAQPGWAPSHAQIVGDLIQDSNGNTQLCTSAGTTGSSTPNWQRTLTATTADGSVIWTMLAVGASAGKQVIDANGNIQTATAITTPAWAGSTGYSLGNIVLDSNGNTQRCIAAGTSGGGPTWATTIGASTTDGGVTWTCVAIGKAAVSGTAAPSWSTTLNGTTNDTIATATGSITWTLTAKGPIANLQAPVLVSGSNPNSLAPGQLGTWGPMIQGFTIPYALNQVFAQGAGQVICVNVFDQTKHYTQITAQTYAFPATDGQIINIGHMGVSIVSMTNAAGSTTYVKNADFKVDHVNGVITAMGGGLLAAGQSVKITCRYADPSKLVASDLVGSVSGGAYTGMQNWKLAYMAMGFFPKLLIAPGFGTSVSTGQSVGSDNATVAAGMATLAAAMRSVYFVDCPAATTPATLMSNRGVSGNAFNTSDKRAILCGPQELFLDGGINPIGISVDPIAGTAIQNPANITHAGPYSPWVAGMTAATDINQGYWYSPSNEGNINGALGPDVSVYASFMDTGSDTNQLNSVGIVTAFQAFGTGIRVWGDRSAGFPSYTTPDVFIPIRRTADVVEQSVMLAMMQFLDQPINNALITSIMASVNAFLRTLISRGALVNGTCTFNPAENPASEIAAGHLTFDISMMPPPPAERLSFSVFLDTSLLSQMTTAAAAA